MSNGRLTQLVNQGKFHEAAVYAKEIADRQPPVSTKHWSNKEYWRWLTFLQRHTVEEIETYMRDPKNRRRP